MRQGLADTSLFIAREDGRALAAEKIPGQLAVSIITYAELRAGVLVASDLEARARRLATLDAISDLEPLPIDRAVADAWAVLRVHLKNSGRSMRLNDSWIAATAISLNIPIISQERDFMNIPGLTTVLV